MWLLFSTSRWISVEVRQYYFRPLLKVLGITCLYLISSIISYAIVIYFLLLKTNFNRLLEESSRVCFITAVKDLNAWLPAQFEIFINHFIPPESPSIGCIWQSSRAWLCLQSYICSRKLTEGLDLPKIDIKYSVAAKRECENRQAAVLVNCLLPQRLIIK